EIIRGREAAEINQAEELEMLHGLVFAVLGVENASDDQVQFLARITGIAERYQQWKSENPSQDISRRVEGWAENIDLQGNHWTVFAKESFTDALRDGHSFIYVDMPPKLPDGATLSDEQSAGRRPYWVSYNANHALNWRIEPEYKTIVLPSGEEIRVLTGRQILAQITFEECSYETDGQYGEREVKRYRVLRPGSWEIYKETKTERGTDYVFEIGGESSLSE